MIIEKLKSFYAKIQELWNTNYYFSFWFIPGNGQNIAKKNVKKDHLKYALAGAGTALGIFVGGLGVMAYISYQNYVQQDELREFQLTKHEQEEKLSQIEKLAEKNQQQLAEIAALEEQVRQHMEKAGVKLPEKADESAYGGKGGPFEGEVSKMNILMEQEKNIDLELQARKENLQQLLTVIKRENYRNEMTPNLWPVNSYDITSSFGGRVNPFDNYSSDWHPGIDIADYYGAPVYASASGMVRQAGWYGGYGRYVKIEHDYGYMTAYGHMSSLCVRNGEYVKKGEIIGYVGSSGYSTGPHLHYEVIQYGRQVNPLQVTKG